MKVLYHKKAIKFINKLPHNEKIKIKRGINKLINNEECDIKKLHDGNYRLRVDSYRIIYTRDNVILFIQNIGNRGDIYKK